MAVILLITRQLFVVDRRLFGRQMFGGGDSIYDYRRRFFAAIFRWRLVAAIFGRRLAAAIFGLRGLLLSGIGD